jgi:hypothetical protein
MSPDRTRSATWVATCSTLPHTCTLQDALPLPPLRVLRQMAAADRPCWQQADTPPRSTSQLADVSFSPSSMSTFVHLVISIGAETSCQSRMRELVRQCNDALENCAQDVYCISLLTLSRAGASEAHTRSLHQPSTHANLRSIRPPQRPRFYQA